MITDQTNPFQKPDDTTTEATVEEPSIVDTILNLDEFLSGDVRRAEKTARFSIKPWLEGEIDDLEGQLEQAYAAPDDEERTLGAAGQSRVVELATRIQTLRQEYAASMRSVRLRQLPADQWLAFDAKWKDALAQDPPYPTEMWDELIVACAIAPAMTAEQVQQLRERVGHPQLNLIAMTAWHVCTNSGVSIPKSPTSSRYLRQQRRERN